MSDELDTIHTALSATGVYLDPSMQQYVDPAELAEIEANVAVSDVPVFVIVYPYSDGDAWAGQYEELVTRLHDRFSDPGLYVSNSSVYDDGYSLGTRVYDQPAEVESDVSFYAGAAAEAEEPTDLGAGLAAMTEIVATGTARERYDASAETTSTSPEVSDSSAETTSTSPEVSDSSESVGRDVDPTGLVIVGLVVLVAAVAGWRWLRRRPQRERGAFVLPASAMDRIRDAHDRRLERQADADTLALGEAIDAADITTRGDQVSWQAALDHYEAARRRQRDGADILDVVGVIVLARRGQRALEAALAGRRFDPVKPCFLNPLHGTAESTSAIERDGRQVRVPLCRTCRNDLRARRRPDILGVLRDGHAVHYFDTDAEPWASTGFGSLEEDLIPRLHGG